MVEISLIHPVPAEQDGKMQDLNSFTAKRPHVAFLPSGLASLTPFFRLASLLASCSCRVTFILIQPQASSNAAYVSRFFIKHPQIKRFDFEIPPLNNSGFTIEDPFIMNFEAINSSIHLLNGILDSLGPASLAAIFSDFVIAASLVQIASTVNLPLYIVSTTSAKFYSTVAYLPVLMTKPDTFSSCHGNLEIPGLAPVRRESIPPTWLHDSPSNYLLKSYLLPNAQSLPKVNGVFLNTFDWFESETIAALRRGQVLSNLPPVFPIGPLEPYQLEEGHHFPWLNEHYPQSVIYVNIGSRGAMTSGQMKELAKALVMCEYSFLWAFRTNQEERDYEYNELRNLFGDSFPEEMKTKGKVLKAFLNQKDILGHPAIGGFINQCEWDSVMDAARQGVPILAWPQHGDQKINAEIVQNAGLGLWVKDWGWAGEKLIKGEEIRDIIEQMMEHSNLRCNAKRVQEEAKKACEVWGSSKEVLMGVIQILKSSEALS